MGAEIGHYYSSGERAKSMEKSNTREEILEAAQFSSLITIWINLCDREPERKEVMELVRKHVMQFLRYLAYCRKCGCDRRPEWRRTDIQRKRTGKCRLHSNGSEKRLLSHLCNRPSGKGRDLFYLHSIERRMKEISENDFNRTLYGI